jgi:putative PIN family toxin of toxin-antitoxin system
MKPRVAFDTNTVVSALLFANGRLAWLRQHWRDGGSTPLISRATVAELTRVLAYPKFRLPPDDRLELLADYLPFCETIELAERCQVVCRDASDQPFLDLAQNGKADLLVTGDDDLLALAGQTLFLIESPEDYRRRVCDQEQPL